MRRLTLALLALLALPQHRCGPIPEAEAAPPVTYGAGFRRVLNEGSLVSSSGHTIDCVGDGISCSASGGVVTFDVSGGGGGGGYDTIEEEGSALAQETTIDFVGAALTAAAGAGQTTVTLSQSPASASVVGTGRTLTCGNALTGCGDLSADRTLAVTTSPASQTPVGATRTLTCGNALTGCGDLSADRTLAVTTSPATQTPVGVTRTLTCGNALTGCGDLSADRTLAVTTTPATQTPVGATRTLTAGTCIGTLGDLSADRTVNVDTTSACAPTWAGAHTFSALMTANGRISVTGGTEANAGLNFTGDTNTGIFSVSADRLDIATGGTSRIAFTNTAIGGTVPFRPADGSAAAPQYSFVSDTDTGIFRAAADNIGFSTGGVERFRMDLWFRAKSHTGFAGSEHYFQTAAVNTTDATPTTIFTLALSDNTLYFMEASCLGRDNAGTERAYYRRSVRAHRQGGGGATLGTTDTAFTDETSAGMDLTYGTSTNSVVIQGTGIAATTISWVCSVRYQGVSTSS